MNRRRSLSAVATALAVLVILTASACGSSDAGAGDSARGASGSSPDTEQPSGSAGGSDPGSEGADPGSDGFVEVCAKLTPEEVGAILGGAVNAEEVPGGGCSFGQDDPRAPSVSFNSSQLIPGNGGFDGAKTGATSMISGTPEDLPGVGDKAFLVVGTMTGGSSQQGSGLVQAGETLVQITLLQSNDLGADDVKAMTTKLLHLAADKAV